MQGTFSFYSKQGLTPKLCSNLHFYFCNSICKIVVKIILNSVHVIQIYQYYILDRLCHIRIMRQIQVVLLFKIKMYNHMSHVIAIILIHPAFNILTYILSLKKYSKHFQLSNMCLCHLKQHVSLIWVRHCLPPLRPLFKRISCRKREKQLSLSCYVRLWYIPQVL